jgi:hypothetical protein
MVNIEPIEPVEGKAPEKIVSEVVRLKELHPNEEIIVEMAVDGLKTYVIPEQHKKNKFGGECWWWIRHGIWSWISDRPRIIKSFFQRGKRGWADSDTWSFDMYLARVIRDGLIYFKKDLTSLPHNLTKEQWDLILNDIVFTFDCAWKITGGPFGDELKYIKSADYTDEWYNKMLDICKSLNEKYDCSDRPMTLEEIKRYENGYKYFAEYFLDLWN